MTVRHRVRAHRRKNSNVRDYERGSGSRAHPFKGEYTPTKRPKMKQQEGTLSVCTKCGYALFEKNGEEAEKYCPRCEGRVQKEHPKAYSLARRALESSGFGKESEGLIATQQQRAEVADAARDSE